MHVEPRIIPLLLLCDDTLVKTTRFADPTYVGDPLNVLSIFNDFEVDEIVLLDIRAAREHRPAPFDQLKRYAEECFIPLAYGGGLEAADDIARLFAAGYEKAILNTSLADHPAEVTEAARRFGSQAIVASVDVRRSETGLRAYVGGGERDTRIDPVTWARRAADLGAGEILLTSIDREGTYAGFDLELVAAVSEAVDVPVIAHGGAAKRAQLLAPVQEAGASAVAAGSLFVFQGRERGVLINYPSRRQIERLLDIAS